MARWSILVLAAVALAGCGSSKHAASTTASVAVGAPAVIKAGPAAAPRKLDVRITASTHLPKVSTPWHYTVRAKADGKAVPARITVRVLYQGSQLVNLGTHTTRNGVVSGTFTWPQVTHAHMLIVEAEAHWNGHAGTDSYQVAGQ